MKITLDNLRVLDAIDRNESFAAAAAELRRVPSAVTYAIKQLESDLDLKIFDRAGYRAKLTPVGRELLEGGRALLEQAQALEQKILQTSGSGSPHIKLAYDAALDFSVLTRVLASFFEKYHEISLTVSGEILNGAYDALLSRRADLVLGAFHELPVDGSFHYVSLGVLPFVFVVAPGHPLAKVEEPLTASDILAHRVAIVSDTSQSLAKASSGYKPEKHFLTLSTMDEKVHAHLASLGVGFLPYPRAKPYIEKGDLIRKKVTRPKAGGQMFIVYRTKNLSQPLKFLIKLLKDGSEDLGIRKHRQP